MLTVHFHVCADKTTQKKKKKKGRKERKKERQRKEENSKILNALFWLYMNVEHHIMRVVIDNFIDAYASRKFTFVIYNGGFFFFRWKMCTCTNLALKNFLQ